MTDRRLALVLASAAAAAAFVLVLAIIASGVAGSGLCCGDDAAMAIVAKNVATGHGYATSLHHTGTIGYFPFDYGISTGPTLILPAALVIALAGPEPWAPGLVVGVACLALLVAIFCATRRAAGHVRACAFFFCFVMVVLLLTPRHIEQWYVLIGEYPAALLGVLAVAILARAPESRGALAAASLLFGLALLTKLLALLSFVPVGIWLACRVVSRRGDRRRVLADAVIAGACLVAPLLAFEGAKLALLGGTEYVRHLAELSTFVSERGADAGGSGWLARVAENATRFSERFHVAPATTVALAIAAVLLVRARARDRFAFRASVLSCATFLVYLAWWQGFSSGPPRYILIGLFFFAATVAMALSVVASKREALAVLAVLGLALVPPFDALSYPVRRMAIDGFRESESLHRLRDTSAFLAALAPEGPFAYSWWAEVADLEYTQPGTLSFARWDKLSPEQVARGPIAVRNRRWKDFPTPEFDAWLAPCREVLLDLPPYQVVRCPPR